MNEAEKIIEEDIERLEKQFKDIETAEYVLLGIQRNSSKGRLSMSDASMLITDEKCKVFMELERLNKALAILRPGTATSEIEF